eukprot:COSAG06_NODE_41350_length_392_cov_0.894198_1_plen_33_part_10
MAGVEEDILEVGGSNRTSIYTGFGWTATILRIR